MPVQVGLYRDNTEFQFPVTVRFNKGKRMGLQFEPLDFDQERALVQCTTARADIWAARWGNHSHVAAHRVMWHIARISSRGFRYMVVHYVRLAGSKFRSNRAHVSRATAKDST